MELSDLFREAKTSIDIVGTNSLIPQLEQSAQLLVDLLTLNPDLEIIILCESDTENFNQSLCTDNDSLRSRMSFASLNLHRDRIVGRSANDGLLSEMRGLLGGGTNSEQILSRFKIFQINLRLPVNLIRVDSRISCSIITTTILGADSYFLIERENRLYSQFSEFIDFYKDPMKGGKYLSQAGEELIQLYDNLGFPRGIFPRTCFYTTQFQRYSVWGFVFNRNGQLLLHQRSMSTKDGRGLWDKSIGGHVDLSDSSTSITAERELIEEMFLPEAEHTKHVTADLGDIIHFGEWSPRKRPERSFKQAFASLGPSDWVMFRATDTSGAPLTITRVSDRRLHSDNGDVNVKKTVFRSDVYCFIAPVGYIDSNEEMKKLLGEAERRGAAQDHRLISIEDLRDWITEQENLGKDSEVFTDDILYVNLRHRDLLANFSEFVKYIAREA